MLVALTMVSPWGAHSEAADDPHVAASVAADQKLRSELGFTTDATFIQSLHDRKRQGRDVHDSLVGVPLSDAEHRELLIRDELGRVDAATTRGFFQARDGFSGLFIDNGAGGRLHVLTTSDASTVETALRPRLRHPDRLVVSQVRWTYADLEATQKAVEAKLRELDARGIAISAITVDEKSNAVQVGLVADTAAHRRAVVDATSPRTPLTFAAQPRLVLAGGNVQNSLPFRGGQSIRPSTKAVPGYDCSIGFVGYQQVSLTTRESAVITGGHCGVSGQPWYQYHEYIGISTVNAWPKSGGTTTADAMRIPIGYGASNDVLGANYAVFNISGSEGQYGGSVGQTVCNNGASSYRVCGVLQQNNVTVATRDDQTEELVVIYYVRQSTADVKLGDSGGPVTHTAGAHYASGIVMGGVPVAPGSNDLEKMHYSHIFNALRELQLTDVYTQ